MAMTPSLLLLSFLPLLFIFTLKAETNVSHQQTLRDHKCTESLGSFTRGSTYEKNRNALLDKINSDKEIDYGFYNFSYGQYPDKVNAIGLCRGDVKPVECRACLRDNAILLIERCQLQKEATGYYDLCMLRYSNDSIFGVVMETSIFYHIRNETQVGDPFKQTLQGLLDKLKNTAADGDSRRKFAEESAPVVESGSNETIYALVQCTPDLSKQNCIQCLDSAFDSAFTGTNKWCDGRKGCLCLGPSCSFKYDTSPFYDPIVTTTDAPPPHPSKSKVAPPALPPSAPPITTKKVKRKTSRTLIAIIVSVAVVGVLLVVICIYYLGARQPRHARHEYIEGEGRNEIFVGEGRNEEEIDEADNDINATELLQFDFSTIKFATINFSDANKLGEGEFGTVYKGTLSDGHEVAIKRLSNNSKQGETEFKNEVLLTGKLQHRNLVKLLGFCLQRGERLLIYEFVSNKSLDYIIFDPIKRANLDWETRYKIIRGIGRSLLYLHEDSRLQIVHRDLKTSNILLDEELNPKISDFGIARLFDANQTQGNTKNVVGTFGYMAPEYIKFGHFSVKSDVFSFGVIILEIVCGQRNIQIRVGENVEDSIKCCMEKLEGRDHFRHCRSHIKPWFRK